LNLDVVCNEKFKNGLIQAQNLFSGVALEKISIRFP